MDALEFAGGLLPSAEPKDIRLVRPGRGGKPAKIYKVDLEAIREKGDVTSNYQIFPGDRLIVGRNDVVKKTIQVDRLAAAMQTVITAISQEIVPAAIPQDHQPGEPRGDSQRSGRFLDPGDEASRRCRARRADPPRCPDPPAPGQTGKEVVRSGLDPIPILHSGSGCPRVSGAKGRASRPRKNTEHMATPA